MMQSLLKVAGLTLMLTACNIEIGWPASGDRQFIAFNRLDMDDSVAVEAQEEKRMLPPAGRSTPNNTTTPARLEGRQEAGDVLKNPLPVTAENLELGQTKATSTAPCATAWTGSSYVQVAQLSDRARDDLGNNLTDERAHKIAQERPGELFHVITAGAAIMGSYAGQLEPLERWAIAPTYAPRMVQNPPSANE